MLSKLFTELLTTRITGIVLTLLILFTALLSASSMVIVQATPINYKCTVLYFFNGIVVYNSTINETLYLETPRNISLVEAYDQKVYHILSYNLYYDESRNLFTFNVTEGGYFEGFFVSRIEICATYTSTSLVRFALSAPNHPDLVLEGSIPEEIAGNFTRTPYERVVTTVKPAFEYWFSRTYGIGVERATQVGLAIAAGYFIQMYYISYDAGTTPRTIDEVIEKRRGDCDDMSRVLVELLNSYNIPAAIQSGYVYVKNFNYTIPVENVTYIFINNGPHAFTTAYVPGYGWVSLDFLAGSLILTPFIFEGYERETAVDEEAVEAFLDLHRALNATQVMAVFDEEEVGKFIGYPVTLENALRFFQAVLRPQTGQQVNSETQVTTPVETTTSEVSPVETSTTGDEVVGAESTPTQTPTRGEPNNLLFTAFMALIIVVFLVVILVLLRKMRE